MRMLNEIQIHENIIILRKLQNVPMVCIWSTLVHMRKIIQEQQCYGILQTPSLKHMVTYRLGFLWAYLYQLE